MLPSKNAYLTSGNEKTEVANPAAPGPEEVSAALQRRLARRFSCEVVAGQDQRRFRLLGLRPVLRRPRPSGAVGGAGGGQDRREAGTFPPARAGEPVAGLGRRAGLPGTCGAGACAARGVAVVSGPDERAFDGNHSGAGDVFALAHARVGRALGTRQAALHRVPVPDWAGEWSLADNRLRLPRRLAADGAVPGLAEGLERVERILPLLSVPTPAVCHGDFQPGNVLVDGDRMSVIDWTDAGVGDRHGNIARTAWVFRLAAAAAAARRGQRVALGALAPVLSRVHLSAYRRELPVDALRPRLPVHLLHAWAMAAADEQELSGPARFRAGLAAWARRQFWRHIDELS
jgi:Phosphotransferase enzyme family